MRKVIQIEKGHSRISVLDPETKEALFSMEYYKEIRHIDLDQSFTSYVNQALEIELEEGVFQLDLKPISEREKLIRDFLDSPFGSKVKNEGLLDAESAQQTIQLIEHSRFFKDMASECYIRFVPKNPGKIKFFRLTTDTDLPEFSEEFMNEYDISIIKMVALLTAFCTSVLQNIPGFLV